MQLEPWPFPWDTSVPGGLEGKRDRECLAWSGSEARVPVISSVITSRFFSRSLYRMGWAALSEPDFGRAVSSEVLFALQTLPLQTQHSLAQTMGRVNPSVGGRMDC